MVELFTNVLRNLSGSLYFVLTMKKLEGPREVQNLPVRL